MKDIRIFISRVPKNGPPKELCRHIFGVQVRVRGYLLIATTEPSHLGEDALVYLVHNDDLRNALADHYGSGFAETLHQFLPVGQVTRIPVDCCEIIPHLPSPEEPT